MTSSRRLVLSGALMASTLMALPAFAHDLYESDQIDREFRQQHERIEQGIRTRELTFRETEMLRNEQTRIAAMIARARIDGRIDPFERREIVAAQANASKHIFAEKHDVEVSAPRRRFGWWHRAMW